MYMKLSRNQVAWITRLSWSSVSKSNNAIMTRPDNIRVIKIPRPPARGSYLRYHAPWLLWANDSCLFCKQRVSRKGWRDLKQRERKRGWWRRAKVKRGGTRGRKKEGWKVKRGCWKTGGRIITSFVRRLEPPHLRNCGSRSSRDCDRWIPQGRHGFC